MAREEGTEAAALPKLLLDLVEQVEGRSTTKPRTTNEDGTKNEEDIQEENIAHNLPKVYDDDYNRDTTIKRVYKMTTNSSVSGVERVT